MRCDRVKRLSYISLYALYGLNFFNHKDRKALRQTQHGKPKVHKVIYN